MDIAEIKTALTTAIAQVDAGNTVEMRPMLEALLHLTTLVEKAPNTVRVDLRRSKSGWEPRMGRGASI